ncbi:ketosynthase [Coralloluteibacterium thermophilus]|uniref:Ketosynthase n=1 Tax=Coralloluteibacterium thermophilum TaxID=2707049 RepID=A0ABV9NLR8_9GAMM
MTAPSSDAASGGRLDTLTMTLLLVSYPVLAHLALHYRSMPLTVAAGLALAVAALWKPLGERRPAAWATLAAVAAALLWLASLRLAVLPLYLPPVAANLFLAWLFARTLRPGVKPLIERLVWHLHGRPAALEPALRDYARCLTWLWTGFFGGVAAVSAVLALFADPDGVLALAGLHNPLPLPQQWWFWFTNVINLALAALIMAVEFGYRRRRFPEHRALYGSLFGFLRRMRTAVPGIWRDLLA